jgi:hypothetical protein
MEALKSKLEAECKMTDLGGVCTIYLPRCGICKRDQAARTITMSQAKYIGGGVEAVWHGGIANQLGPHLIQR